MEKILKGTAFVFAKDDIDTDLIIPARYLTTSDEAELAWHVLEPLRSDDELLEAGGLKQIGDESSSSKTSANLVDIEKFKLPIVVAGENFGCGSSREHAVWALRGAGVKVVIAKSFARIFFRNAVNNGFLAIECPEALDKIVNKDMLEIDVEKGEIKNLSNNQTLIFHKIPDFVLEIREKGGLLNTIKS